MVSEGSMVQVADPFLSNLIEQLNAIRVDARALGDGVSPVQFNWKPDAKRWSTGQCIEHLTLTLRLYPESVERMIAEAKRRAETSRPYREGWVSRWVVSGMEPPPRLRIRTMRRAEPGTDLDRDTTIREFEVEAARLHDLLVACDGVSLRHGRMRSPFAPLLRFTLRQVLCMNLAHARRHLWQARQVHQHANFPS